MRPQLTTRTRVTPDFAVAECRCTCAADMEWNTETLGCPKNDVICSVIFSLRGPSPDTPEMIKKLTELLAE